MSAQVVTNRVLLLFLFLTTILIAGISDSYACNAGSVSLGKPTGPNSSSTRNYTIGGLNYTLCERRNTGGGWSSWQSVAYSGNSKYFSGKANGTYEYRQYKAATFGPAYCHQNGLPMSYCTNQLSQTKTVTVSYNPAPATPARPSAPSQVGNGSYTVTWTKPSGSVSFYQLRRGNTVVYSGGSLSYSVNSQADGTYRYSVRACKKEGSTNYCSAYSGQTSVKVDRHPDICSATGVNVLSTPTAPNNVKNRNYTVSNLAHTVCERKKTGNSWTAWTAISYSSGAKTFTNKPDGVYQYIKAKHPPYGGTYCQQNGLPPEYCQPNLSPLKTVTVQYNPAPATPAKPSAPSVVGNGNYTVEWTKPSGTVSIYQLKRGNTIVYSGSALSYSANNQADGTYQYSVRACKTEGSTNYCSAYSAQTSVTVDVHPDICSATGVLVLSTPTAPDNVKNRNYTVSNLAHTVCERKKNGNSWTAWTAISYSSGAKTFTNKPDGIYQYIKAKHPPYGGAYCDQNGLTPEYCQPNLSGLKTVDVKYNPAPATPAKPSAPSVVGNGNYTVEWTKPSGTVSFYQLQRGNNVIYSGTGTSYIVTGQADGTYLYSVRACIKEGNTDYCSAYSAQTTVNVDVHPDICSATGVQVLSTPTAPDNVKNRNYTVSNLEHIVCERAKNGNTWGAWNRLSYSNGNKSFTNRADGVYQYIKAKHPPYGGAYCQQNGLTPEYCQPNLSGLKTVNVQYNPAPATPVRPSAPSEVGNGNYTVEWTKPAGTVSFYELKRDNTVVYNGIALSFAVNNQADGTYQYSVRACKTEGTTHYCSNYSDPTSVKVDRHPDICSASGVQILSAPVAPDNVKNRNYTVSNLEHIICERINNGGGWSQWARISYSGSSKDYTNIADSQRQYIKAKYPPFGGAYCQQNGLTPEYCEPNLSPVKLVVVKYDPTPDIPARPSAPNTDSDGNYAISWTKPPTRVSHYQLTRGNDVIYTGPETNYTENGRPNGEHSYSVSACFIENNITYCSAYSEAVTVLVNNQQSNGDILPADIAGQLSYEAGVTHRGEAIVSVPVKTVTGINNMQPNLRVAYSSGREDHRLSTTKLPQDYLGSGWHIGGLSEIRHCQRFNSSQGGGDEVYERLCLDGEPVMDARDHFALRNDDFRKIERVNVPGTGTSVWWYQVTMSDGTVMEYGSTPDSRYRKPLPTPVGEQWEATWKLRKQTDVFGNSVHYHYNRETEESEMYPTHITYGPGQDTRIDFYYDIRTPITGENWTLPPNAPQPMIDAHREREQEIRELNSKQRVLLKRITIKHHNILTGEYRFNSLSAASGHERLQHLQYCGYDSSGTIRSCLPELSFDWQAHDKEHRTNVVRVYDSNGRATQFLYTTMEVGQQHAQFSEQPFGAAPYQDNIFEPRHTLKPLYEGDNDLRTVVTEEKTHNGKSGWHTLQYAYQGRGWIGKEGFWGFDIQRIHDPASTRTVYRRFWFADKTRQARVVHEYSYLGFYGSGTILSQTVNDYTERYIGHGSVANPNNSLIVWYRRTFYLYPEKQTHYIYEGGQLLGVTQKTTTPDFTVNTGGGEVHGTLVQAIDTETIWADNIDASGNISGARRSLKTHEAFVNDKDAWIIGFSERRETEQLHHHSGSLTSTRTDGQEVVTMTQHVTASGQKTLLPDIETHYPGDTELNLSMDYSYDAAGRLTGTTTSGAHITSRSSSVSGFVDGRYPQNISKPHGHSTSQDYDLRFGQPTSITDINGLITSIEYDALGREISRTVPDGYTISTSYDDCAVVTCPMVGGINPALRIQISSPISPSVTEYVDSLGDILRKSTVGFDGTSSINVDTLYDSRGRIAQQSLPYFTGSTPGYINYQYDNRDRQTQVSYPDGKVIDTVYSADATNGRAVTSDTETIYDSAGMLLSTRTDKRYTNYIGDLERVIEAHGDAKQIETRYEYYGTGLTQSVDVDNIRTADFVYDKAGNRTALDDANAGRQTDLYTALGEVRSSTDAAGNTITNEYDQLGRLVTRISGDGTANWVYDPVSAKGALDYNEFVDNRLEYYHKTDHSYNTSAKLNNTTTTIRVPDFSDRVYQQALSYDTYGRVDTAQHPSGITIKHHYNSSGYLESISDNASSTALRTVTAMDAFGNTTHINHGNGLSTVNIYDSSSGRLTGIQTGTLQDNSYAYRSDGLLESRSNSVQSSKQEQFTYDSLKRLDTADTYISSTLRRQTSTQYALNGNIEAQHDNTGKNITGYQYGTTPNAGPHAVSQVNIGGVAHTLSYNANGAITEYSAASGDSKFIDWTARGKPQTITKGASATEVSPKARDQFAYGADGMRYYKKSTWAPSFTVIPISTLESTASSNVKTEHTFYIGNYEDVVTDADQQYSRIEKTRIAGSVLHKRLTNTSNVQTEETEFLLRDHLGSIEVITDATGNSEKNLSYDAFGERRNTDWTQELTTLQLEALANELDQHTTRGYTEHEHLDRTGLIHMNGRVYDPTLGRFLSPDPLVQSPYSSQSYNRYTYAFNNPLTRTDPSGYGSGSINSVVGQGSWASRGMGWGVGSAAQRRASFFASILDAQPNAMAPVYGNMYEVVLGMLMDAQKGPEMMKAMMLKTTEVEISGFGGGQTEPGDPESDPRKGHVKLRFVSDGLSIDADGNLTLVGSIGFSEGQQARAEKFKNKVNGTHTAKNEEGESISLTINLTLTEGGKGGDFRVQNIRDFAKANKTTSRKIKNNEDCDTACASASHKRAQVLFRHSGITGTMAIHELFHMLGFGGHQSWGIMYDNTGQANLIYEDIVDLRKLYFGK